MFYKMNRKHEDSFNWKGDYYYRENNQYWKLKFGTKKISVCKKEYYKLKEKANGRI